MQMTLEQITAHENQLLAQIAQSHRLLATYQLLRTEQAALLPTGSDAADDAGTTSESSAVPAPAPRPRPVNLEALRQGYGGGIRVTTWAIRQMNGQFSVRHLAAVLRQAGCPMCMSRLSVILNRMKDYGKVKEVVHGRGRTPSLFSATAAIAARPLEYCARHSTDRPRGTYRPPVVW